MTPAPDLRFASGYADWGKCELCGVEVPPTGARIGFFGKADVYPQWCRPCVEQSGDAELLENLGPPPPGPEKWVTSGCGAHP